MFEKAEGTVQKIAGQIQEAVGSAAGNAGTQFEGKTRQLGGKAQEFCGDALSQVRQSAMSNPIATIAIAAALALVVGAALAKR